MAHVKGINLLVIIVVVCTVSFGFCVYRGHEQHRRFEKISIGMSMGDVNRLFKQKPDFTCTYKGKVLAYYRNRFSNFGDEPVSNVADGSKIEKREDIPDVYDAIQIMMDASGKVEAYTWNGETNTIFTLHGDVKGANVRQLDESFFE